MGLPAKGGDNPILCDESEGPSWFCDKATIGPERQRSENPYRRAFGSLTAMSRENPTSLARESHRVEQARRGRRRRSHEPQESSNEVACDTQSMREHLVCMLETLSNVPRSRNGTLKTKTNEGKTGSPWDEAEGDA